MAIEPVIIIVDELPPNSVGADLWENGILWKVSLQRVYHGDLGKLVIPTAGEPGDEPIICQVHSGVYFMDVIYEIERLGAPPVCPSMELDDENLELLWYKFKPSAPVDHDGVLFKHCVSGHYHFVMREPPSIEEGFKTEHCIYWTNAKVNYKTTAFSKAYTEWVTTPGNPEWWITRQ